MPRPPRALALGRSAGGGPPWTLDGVDLVLGAVAVDRGPRRPGDDGADPVAKRAPDQPVDQRVLERLERARRPQRAMRDQPVGIIAPGMGHRQQHRQLAARRMDDRAG